jgi:hypothetical protein
MLVVVKVGLTPYQFALGQPAATAETVSGALSTAGLVLRQKGRGAQARLS